MSKTVENLDHHDKLNAEILTTTLNDIGLFLFNFHKKSLKGKITLGEFFNDLEDIIIGIDKKYKLHMEKEADDE